MSSTEVTALLTDMLQKASELQFKTDTMRYLIERLGSDLDLSQSLHTAVHNENTDYVTLLLEAGADVNHQDSEGKPCLFDATGKINLVKLLLDAGADVNIRNTKGQALISHVLLSMKGKWATPHISELREAEAAVRLFLAAGADVNVNRMSFRVSNWVSPSEEVKGRLAMLLFAAGEKTLHRRPLRTPFFPIRFFPPGWYELDLKNQCRKVIRKHLLTLDPHTNLFIRVQQLEHTDERAGLPENLISYLLYEQSLEVDWKEIQPFHRL